MNEAEAGPRNREKEGGNGKVEKIISLADWLLDGQLLFASTGMKIEKTDDLLEISYDLPRNSDDYVQSSMGSDRVSMKIDIRKKTSEKESLLSDLLRRLRGAVLIRLNTLDGHKDRLTELRKIGAAAEMIKIEIGSISEADEILMSMGFALSGYPSEREQKTGASLNKFPMRIEDVVLEFPSVNGRVKMVFDPKKRIEVKN